MHPIDAFLQSHWKPESAVAPAAKPADLIRRATLDLTGLLPTFDEVRALERDLANNRDDSRGKTDAWVKTVDRLLPSPRYGEKMAQHWLDVARYAALTACFAIDPVTCE